MLLFTRRKNSSDSQSALCTHSAVCSLYFVSDLLSAFCINRYLWHQYSLFLVTFIHTTHIILQYKTASKSIGSKFLNNVEISAREAVYITLQLPMRKESRQIIFINTSPPNERVELLKPIEDIKEMDDDSEEIYTTGLLKRYCKHPPKLENLTLADWAAWYDNCSSKPYVKETRD